ncbi:hypothetical protein ACIBHX_41445 [Nonomuraea sp. NPDC050536]|uniref:hypothetical protein n=1 Tax=Nonomuraea sp. NPDC050536 TaxID=3364366 RepID=UPI0037C97546
MAGTTVTDRTGYAPSMITAYVYGDGKGGGAAWHYADDDGLSKSSKEDGKTKQLYKTWSQWRGYRDVRC